MRWALLSTLLWAGCRQSDDQSRTSLIINTLVGADLDLIALRPDLVAEKYALMATTPQTFLRGTASLFYHDLTRALGDGTLPHGDGAELVWLYGDPHLENLGSTFDDDGMLFDCIDFDAAVQGPFDWDVRRAALALAVGLQIAGRDDGATQAAARSLAQGWLTSVQAAHDGPILPLRPGSLGRVVEDVLADGAKKQGERQDLTKYTALDDTGGRTLLREADMVELPAPFSGELTQALRDWSGVRRGGPVDDSWIAVKDAVQRLDSGVASLPNLRFWLLLDGPPGADDDRILELKEERTPPEPIALLGRGPTATPFDDAARVTAGAAALLSSRGAEADLGRVTIEGVHFQARSVSRGRVEVAVDDLAAAVAAGTYSDDDLAALGGTIGRLLGAGHARNAAPDALLGAAGDAGGFAAETAARALDDRDRLLHDLDLYRAALQARGPLLGARP